jgi:hypothetical protein
MDQLIDDVTSKVHDAAADELEQFLFEDKLTGSASGAAGTTSDEPSEESPDADDTTVSPEAAGA